MVVLEHDLDLGREDPSPGPTTPRAAVIGPPDLDREPELGAAVRAARHGLADKLPVDDLVEALSFRDGKEILDRGEAKLGSGARHGRSIEPQAQRGQRPHLARAGLRRPADASSAPWYQAAPHPLIGLQS